MDSSTWGSTRLSIEISNQVIFCWATIQTIQISKSPILVLPGRNLRWTMRMRCSIPCVEPQSTWLQKSSELVVHSAMQKKLIYGLLVSSSSRCLWDNLPSRVRTCMLSRTRLIKVSTWSQKMLSSQGERSTSFRNYFSQILRSEWLGKNFSTTHLSKVWRVTQTHLILINNQAQMKSE